jgi:hypothetical protein
MSQESEESLLQHSTHLTSLYHILTTSEILSPTELNRRTGYKLSHEVHNDSVFFTPLFFSRFVRLKKILPSIFLDFEKTLVIYPEYYINEGNSFGPLDGKLGKNKTCKCINTYHHNLNYSNFKPELINAINEPCYNNNIIEKIKTIERDIIPLQLYDTCEGGPEVGIITPTVNFSINNILKYVVVPCRQKITEHTISFINSIPEFTTNTTSNIEKVDNFYNFLKERTEICNGKFIELCDRSKAFNQIDSVVLSTGDRSPEEMSNGGKKTKKYIKKIRKYNKKTKKYNKKSKKSKKTKTF